MTHGDDFVVTGPTGWLADLRNKISRAYPRKTKNTQLKIALVKARSGISTILDMLMGS